MVAHEHLMRRALDLASQGAGYTSPNPMVGAVIESDGQIIGEGYHHAAGQPHAEVEALRAVKEGARGATMYVSLEPCCVSGRTPPCTEAVIAAGISQVYYATPDENPKVSGGGHRLLAAAGIRVRRGPLEREARFLNRAFFHHIKTGLPWVTAKYAMSLDGRIATAGGESQWITGPEARRVGHQLRHVSDGILVGRATAVADNPRLTTRLQGQAVLHPTRILLDSRGATPLTARLFDSDLPGETWVATTGAMPETVRHELVKRSVQILDCSSDPRGRVDLASLMTVLGERQMTSLMVEGGAETLGSFFAAGLIHEVWAFVGARLIGGTAAPGPIGGEGSIGLAQAAKLQIYESRLVGQDLLVKAVVGDKNTLV